MVETRQFDGRTITFRRTQGRSPALVCIHGSASNHHTYDRLLDALPERDGYALDLPGRAGTAGPPLDNVADMNRFLSAFVDREVEGEYVLAGHSLGGAVAIEHALSSDDGRLRGIVLLSTGARLRVHPVILAMFEQAKKSGVHPPVPTDLYERGTDPAFLEEAAREFALTPISTGAADWHACDTFNRMTDLPRVAVPALIVVGTNDALTPLKYAEHMAGSIPVSDLLVIEGAGHALVVERAAEVSEAIQGFLARV